jgi:hypothetical protein
MYTYLFIEKLITAPGHIFEKDGKSLPPPKRLILRGALEIITLNITLFKSHIHEH